MEQAAASLADYYAARAPEYDRIYEKPERQEDLRKLRELVREMFRGQDVVDIACGTGYWTEVLAEVARSVIAIDINESVLRIARTRPGAERVRFVRADAYELPELPPVSGCLCAFWWSHVPKGRLEGFLGGLHGRLARGAKVLFMDNCYVEGNSTAVSRTDADGNTYQARRLENGSSHEVIKNFPSEAELKEAVGPYTEGSRVEFLTYYWTLGYRFERK